MTEDREPTFCEDCDSCIRNHDGGKSDLPAYRWLCAMSPRLDPGNFVSRSLRIAEPYFRCSVANLGDCRKFSPRRTPTK